MLKNVFAALLLVAVVFSSCSSLSHEMKQANTLVRFEKGDFELSDQVEGEATSTRILMIDFDRLFSSKKGHARGGESSGFSLASIPVIGDKLTDPTSNYALYEMMSNNEGYDVVFYPQYETNVKKPIGLGFLYKITTVKAKARLGKLKK